MRIAYLVHQYPPDHIGGTELYTQGVVRRAAAAGHEVVVLTHRECPTVRPADFVARSRECDGIAVRELAHNLSASPNIARNEYENPFAGAWVGAELERWRPDLVHATHVMKLGVRALDACRALGVPVVVTLTDYWFLCPRHTLLTWDARLCDGPRDWRECLRCVMDLHGVGGRRAEAKAVRARPERMRSVLAAVDRIVVLSPFLVRMFAANGFATGGMEVVPHGPERADLVRPPARTRTGPTRFAVVGTVVPSKGVHVAVDALLAAPGLDAELVVHGPVPDEPFGRDLLAAAAGDPRVSFAGPYPPAAFGRLLAEADYLLAPSLAYDNAPLVVKGALHLGVPVIASGIGTLADMVEDGVDGWTVPPGDVGAWRAALERAVDERERWPRRGRPQPDMDDHAARLMEIYEEVVSARRSSSRS